ncbi:SCP2 sterol-binding domain-containing protein [Brevibacillus composti]|uniref:SCP2 sterol-binding domain-containing protein n=1 Tax=Brevibacillus composti TaxID=2796470 RepID=A0A7T5ENY8_9BACL|nr:SCP2 sterol-binding domain-containing protein [Brevibacillus composti]QQE76114.1 SCP2 sterol-binding domain-containing protein [Brevibacillus composti]QUO43143.1 SCP2 sterol-binding domain-containing protein [Brevibacillus composti]
MTVSRMIAELAEKINANPAGLDGLSAVFHFHLKESGLYQISFAGDSVSVAEGGPDQAACSLEMSDSSFIKLVTGELNPTTAFMMGKIKAKGNLGLALKLHAVLQNYR